MNIHMQQCSCHSDLLLEQRNWVLDHMCCGDSGCRVLQFAVSKSFHVEGFFPTRREHTDTREVRTRLFDANHPAEILAVPTQNSMVHLRSRFVLVVRCQLPVRDLHSDQILREVVRE